MIAYRLAARAEDDLRGVFWQGMELFGPHQTERYLSELEETFERLGRFPQAGRLRTDLDPPARVYPHGAHIIVYEHHHDGVLILRIRAARENWVPTPNKDDQP